MTAAVTEQAHHATSLAVWDIPVAVAGERFSVKVGAKSAAGCSLRGCRVEVLDGNGAVAATARLGGEPWPDTAGLFWSEVELCAPSSAGLAAFAVHVDATGLADPHEVASAPFNIAVVAAPEHVLTVTVADRNGGAVTEAIVRAGAVRATTNAEGRARLHLAKGAYDIVVWKAGYEAEPVPMTVEAEAALSIEARALPEDDPDAIWTA